MCSLFPFERAIDRFGLEERAARRSREQLGFTGRRSNSTGTTTPGNDHLATGRFDRMSCDSAARFTSVSKSRSECDLLPAGFLFRPLGHRLAQRDGPVQVAEVDAQQEIVAERLRAALTRSLHFAEVLAQVPEPEGKASLLSDSPKFGVRVSTLMMGETESIGVE